MRLIPPPKVEKLQVALHTKAKGSPSYRFYALYDKIYREDVLRHAFYCCLANQGAPGVDGQTFQQIEAYGEEKWLAELAEELRQQTYRPQPLRRVNIPKEGQPGKTRPLGIPCIRDRVVQMATVSGLGTNLRGRPGAGAIRVSSRTEREGRREACRVATPCGFHGGG